MHLEHRLLHTQGQAKVVFSLSHKTWKKKVRPKHAGGVLGGACYLCLFLSDVCDLFASALFDRSENNCYLYGVFNGYDGNRVTNFVGQRLSAELLLGQLHADHSDADVRRVLLQVKKLWLGTAPVSRATHQLFLMPGEQHLVFVEVGNICRWLRLRSS